MNKKKEKTKVENQTEEMNEEINEEVQEQTEQNLDTNSLIEELIVEKERYIDELKKANEEIAKLKHKNHLFGLKIEQIGDVLKQDQVSASAKANMIMNIITSNV
jgi:hypothetical protein